MAHWFTALAPLAEDPDLSPRIPMKSHTTIPTPFPGVLPSTDTGHMLTVHTHAGQKFIHIKLNNRLRKERSAVCGGRGQAGKRGRIPVLY